VGLTASSIAYLAVVTLIARFVLPWLYRHLVGRARVDELEVSVLLIVALGFSVLGELMGQHFILGPFVAGLFFGRRQISEEVFERVESKIEGLTSGFLAPLFFVSIGLHTDVTALAATPIFFASLLAIAFVAKIVGAVIPASLGGFGRRDALAVGVGMSGRGAVELIIADVALRSGVFSSPDPTPPVVENMFGTIVLVAVITTISTPILLRRLLGVRRSTNPVDDATGYGPQRARS
jgi:Kef-type K+ transport system membrane component KefB